MILSRVQKVENLKGNLILEFEEKQSMQTRGPNDKVG